MPVPREDDNWPDAKILIAEDDEFSFQFFNVILREKGFEIIRAKNGSEALRLFGEHRDINLILMDMQLPEIDGFEVTRKIREQDPDIPIIAQTAYVQKDEKDKCLEAGCTAYIAKPVDLKQLVKLVDGFLG